MDLTELLTIIKVIIHDFEVDYYAKVVLLISINLAILSIFNVLVSMRYDREKRRRRKKTNSNILIYEVEENFCQHTQQKKKVKIAR
jgi:hypothetical protein